MKNIIAISIVISSIVFLLNKYMNFYSSWKKTVGEIIEIKQILNKKNLGEIRYQYQVNEKLYDGLIITDINKSKDFKNSKIPIYYHKINPELSFKNVPKSLNLENYILILLSLVGGLYLYFYSCESCEIPKTKLRDFK